MKVINNKKIMDNGLGKLPPMNLEAEKIVLTASLDGHFDLVATYIKDNDEFYKEANQLIFNAMQEIYLEQNDITMYQVRKKLAHKFEIVGGANYLLEITNNNYQFTDIVPSCMAIVETKIARQTIFACNEITKGIYDQMDVFDAVDAMNEHNNFVLKKVSALKTFNFEKAKESVIENTIEKHAGKSKDSLNSMIRKLDNCMGGFRKKSLNTIGARPGAGKSGFAIQLAHNFSIKQDFKTLIFSLEMSESENIERLLANHLSFYSKTEYTNFEIIKGFTANENKLNDFVKGARDFKTDKIFIYDNIFHIEKIRAKSIELVKNKGVDVIIIDHLHIIKSNEKTEIERLTEITGKLKVLAKECNVPIILLAQLNREVEKRTDKKPMMSDLRGSGATEQDSDTVSFMYRPFYYDQENSDENQLIYTVSKNRNGVTGDLNLWCNVKNSTILDEAPIQQLMNFPDVKSSLF
jgi:replicative DNA helicase